VTAALYKVKMPDAIRGMWRALQKYDQEELNAVFSDPVSRRDYPDYYTDIAQPMDLKTLGWVCLNSHRMHSSVHHMCVSS